METIAVRLTDGQDLLVEIKDVTFKQDIEAGVILSGVGSLKKAKIRVPVINGEVKYIEPQNLEIDALHGTVSKNGCHVHITVSDISGNAYGGHIKEGCIVRTTCELVIGIVKNTRFKRTLDPATGFEELVIETA
ncbi:MAG: PPC domain-containing DNA-binding protein [bacterium]